MRNLLLICFNFIVTFCLIGQTVSEFGVENVQSQHVSLYQFVIVILIGILLISIYIFYRQKQQDSRLIEERGEEIIRQEEEMNHKNLELEAKNISLDLLNKKLLSEITVRESIERSSFARDRFLANMSNQMRIPLNDIIGLSHILLKENQREDQIDHLRSLQFSTNDLVVFINDILDFSKIEVGKLKLEDREFSPRDAIYGIQKRFLGQANKSKLLINFYYDPKIPDILLGDDIQLSQILTNLLTNTINHTKEGNIKIAIMLHDLQAKDAMLKITILGTDGGLGRHTIEEMFKSHHAGDIDFEVYDNQHFSLAIAKRLVELQNGKIDVEFSPDDGTTFTVLLPYKLVMETENNRKQHFTLPENTFEGSHVLLVEDNKINQLVVSKILKKAGFEVTLANNGFEALTKVETNDFDLILMDIQMPEMDGYKATAEIRRHSNENKRAVPIIALTASAFLTEKEKAVLFGMNDHIGKPFSPDEMMEKIKNCLADYSVNSAG